jgi:trans-aconitate methyltransferase
MLAQAAKEDIPGAPVRWQAADLATWAAAQPCDVIYSNAALHWMGDHARQFPRLIGQLAPKGVLAAQMPRNFAAPSHALMTTAAQAGPWRERLQSHLRAMPVAEPQEYYDLLAPLCASVDIWETEYQQVLTGENPVAEFTKGSWLKSLLDALQEPERGQFEAEYRRLVLEAYPRRRCSRSSACSSSRRWREAPSYRTVPRAATVHTVSTRPSRTAYTRSCKLLTTQQWFGTTVTRSPIAGLARHAARSTTPCSSDSAPITASGYSTIRP